PDESLRSERHAAECAACAQELAQRRLLDRELGRLCSPIHFAGDWDQRVQARWRKTHRPPRRLPAPVRWAGAAAAVVLIGALGAAVNAVAQQGMITFPGGDALQANGFQLGADQVGGTVLAYATRSSKGQEADETEAGDSRRSQAQNNLKQVRFGMHWGDDMGELDGFKVTYGRQSDVKESNSIEFQPPALALVVPNAERVHTSVAGGIIGGKPTSKETAMSESERRSRSKDVSVPGSATPADALGILDGEATKRLKGLQELLLDDNSVTLGVQVNDGSVRNGRWGRAPSDAYARQGKVLEDSKARSREDAKEATTFGRDVKAPPLRPTAGFGARASESKPSDSDARTSEKAEQARLAKMNQLRAGAEYFKVATAAGGEVQDKAGKSGGLLAKQQDDVKRDEPRALGARTAPQEEAKKEQAQDAPSPVGVGQPKADPQVAQRKIIRTGDLEFEVSVFDDTVAQIAKLIGAIPGAYVATVNSEKLPNGKVKGSVVVRVPPEALDKFVLDLRQALAKMGELKSQKIGSADVTKQYTDIESRLRAARTMEERFIAIIKNGKGEVKDLIAAERELGVWRTKIEEMEGEIRYYNSQVALSTLTITAYEKEIRAAAAMVITEHVTMKIEADDVEKSLQTALLAVTEAKGRVTKSDLKQHAAGQLEAVLSFEVAPAQAGAVKDKLKGLGIVTHHDTQRLQQAEGGTAPAGEIKSRSDDVRFNVTLYNVANIQPREAYVLQVVVTDVPAEYKKLLDGVAAAKGQVRVSQLDEKDRTNTFAQLDFDVPATQRELFDKVLAGLGDVVSRNTTRAGPGESATDRKVGYRLTLKSEASVPPRETFTLNVYSLDVPAAYRKLQDAAAQLKGHVRALQLNEQDRNNISAQFDVDLVRTDMAVLDKLLDEAGEVASRTTSRVQPGEIATDRKVGYRLTLRSQTPPRETLDLNIEVADVERSAATLATLVKGVQGRVTAWEGTQDASGKSVAIQLFDVPLAAKESLAAQFKAIGKVRGQKAAQNLQATDGKLATAHLNVRLTNVTPIVASDDGLWPQVRRSLSYAFTLLSVSLMFLIVGVSVLLPWVLIVWVGVKVVRRMRNKGQATA
ncbi:MAG TPA: DUF4349 domain-containing protein, partial [Gemmataceae bacterium]|nr:DUF4349 domain-containing protein [Gemmataceae bacterium]